MKKKRGTGLWFESLSRTMIRFRYPVILSILLLTAALALQIRDLEIDTSNEGLLRPQDPILLAYNEFRDQFGRDDILLLAIESDNIFSAGFLEKLKRLHETLEAEVPHVNEITSLINARDTRGEGDTLLVDDLFAVFPQDEGELAFLRKRALANPIYKNLLISEEGDFTTVLIQSDTYTSAGVETDALEGFDEVMGQSDSSSPSDPPEYLSDEENGAMVHAAEKVVREFDAPDFRIVMAGSPVVTHTVKQLMMRDVKRFLRLAVLTIGVCLFIMFRRVSGVVLPLLVVAMTLVGTLGLMALTGTSFKTPTVILPSFLLAVGVGASVHVLSLVYENLRRELPLKEAIVHAYGHSGLAILMTSLTTAAGLASFAAAKVAPIADLGMFSSVGVLLSLFYTLALLPALLSLLALKASGARLSRVTRLDRFLDWVAGRTTTRPKLIIGITAIGVAVAMTGLPRLEFSHNLLNWLPENLPVRQATELIDHNLRGSVALELVLDTGRENGLYDRELLLALDRLGTDLEQFRQGELFVGKVVSVTSILKEIHQALNENKPEFYAIPDNAALIPQEFLLFENSGSDDLQDVVDSRFSKARLTIKVPWDDALAYVPFMREIEKRFRDAVSGLEKEMPVQVTTTGIMALFARILHATIYSAAQSYCLAFVVITLMMVLLIGNLRLGLIAMLPNLGPIFVVMGIMGWFSIPLDMFTMLVASVAIGLAVDDTVHFFYNFKRYYTDSADVGEAVRLTLHTAGRAMLTTSIVLSIGFFIFMFASMHNVFYFGMLVGVAILLALAGDFFLAPALMALYAEKMLKKEVTEKGQ
jgi:predicted RND superfamily exporter protein